VQLCDAQYQAYCGGQPIAESNVCPHLVVLDALLRDGALSGTALSMLQNTQVAEHFTGMLILLQHC
jgi:hypothetical protein